MFLSVVVWVLFRDFIEGTRNSIRVIMQLRSVSMVVLNVVSSLPDLQGRVVQTGNHRNPFFPRTSRFLVNLVPQIVWLSMVVFMVRLTNGMMPNVLYRFTDYVHVSVVAVVSLRRFGVLVILNRRFGLDFKTRVMTFVSLENYAPMESVLGESTTRQ